jgi:2-polyprenyl-6-methoxyphenol hydroxylase-like FAD-dependent oxidoreductase
MTFAPTAETNVLVVGAGPTGLTVAVSLLARGRNITVVDKQKEGSNTSRAAVVYPGTLELLAIRCCSAIGGPGDPHTAIRYTRSDRVLTPVDFSNLPTAFPYALLVSQAVTEAVLLQRLEELGGQVRRPCDVVHVDQDESGATVTFAGGERVRAAFVVGADGVHSTVREQAKIGLSGNPHGASYSLADVHLTGGVPSDELVVYFSPAGHLVVLPLPGGIHRIVAHVSEAPEEPDAPFLQKVLDTRGPQAERAIIHDVVWGSRFLTRHAIASRYRAGRIVLAGDAAHVHSPLGGQGMNLGIHDAIALGHELSRIVQGASPDLLDAYNSTRGRLPSR